MFETILIVYVIGFVLTLSWRLSRWLVAASYEDPEWGPIFG